MTALIGVAALLCLCTLVCPSSGETLASLNFQTNANLIDSTLTQYENVTTVSGLFRFYNCDNVQFRNIIAFESLVNVGGGVNIELNAAVKNITFASLVDVSGTFNFNISSNAALETMTFASLLVVSGDFEIANNPLLTTDAIDNAFPNLQCIDGDVTCVKCPQRIKDLANTGPCTAAPTAAPTPSPTAAPTPSPSDTPPITASPTAAPSDTPPDTPSPTTFSTGSGELTGRLPSPTSAGSKSKSGKMGMSKGKMGMSKGKMGMSKGKMGMSAMTNTVTDLTSSSLQSYVQGSSASFGAGLVGCIVLIAGVAVVAYKRQQKIAGFNVVASTTVEFPSESTPLV